VLALEHYNYKACDVSIDSSLYVYFQIVTFSKLKTVFEILPIFLSSEKLVNESCDQVCRLTMLPITLSRYKKKY
jgi:hypothetical protein